MPLTVLVIDDQPLEGEMVAYVLRKNRPDVVYAGQALNADEGIQMTTLHQPDLIFLDIKMPGMDGLTAIGHLRGACSHSQIVILSAFDDFTYLRGALRAGARDYLLKPVRPNDILAALDMLTESAPQPIPTPSGAVTGGDQLAEAIQAGDCALAERLAREYLSSYLLLDQANIIHAGVRCMEFSARLAHSSGEAGDGLTYLHQDFVQQVSALRDPELFREQFCAFVRDAANVFNHAAGDVGYRQVTEAKQYIAEHFHEAIQLSEVARRLYLSTAYFSRLFKEKTGQTFSDYLAACRVDKARHLLATTDLSIAEVASAIGYQEANSFSRLFKARTGQSPSDYRSAQHKI